MEVFERRDYRAVILQENSTVQLCLYDSFYDVAFTDPSILFVGSRACAANHYVIAQKCPYI